MPAPLPSEFAALVPSGATDVKQTSQATGAELRKIMLGTGSDDSLAHLMKQWMENWFDDSGEIVDPLKTILCAQDCVQNASTSPTVPTTTGATTSTSTSTTTTTTAAPGATTTTTTTTTAWPAQARAFSSADAGSKITWTNLPAGTYVVRYTGGYYEVNAGVTTYYGTVQGVTDGTSPLGGLLSTNQTDAGQAGTDYNNGLTGGSSPSNPRVYSVGEGGSIELELQWMTPGTPTMYALTFTLSRT